MTDDLENHVPAEALSRIWALVTFLHPRGLDPVWSRAFDAAFDHAAGLPDDTALTTALAALGDPLTGPMPREPTEPQSPEPADPVLRARDYLDHEYDPTLGRILRRDVRRAQTNDRVTVDLRGATWWFIHQFGAVLADLLGSPLVLPPESARAVSGATLDEFATSGAPWSGVVHLAPLSFHPSTELAPGCTPEVHLQVHGQGALAGRLAIAAQRAGAHIHHVNPTRIACGNTVRVESAGRQALRIRTSWTEDYAENGTATEPPGPVPTHTAPAQPSPPDTARTLIKLSGYLRFFYPYTDARLERALETATAEIDRATQDPDSGTSDEAYLRTMTHLNDSHARIYSPTYNHLFGHANDRSPFRLHEHSVLLAQAAGPLADIPAGSQLLEVDGVRVEDRIQRLLSAHSHSSDRAAAWLIERYLLGNCTDHTDLLFARPDGSRAGVRARTTAIGEYKADPFFVSDGLMYIDLTRLDEKVLAQAGRHLATARALTLDLRGYVAPTAWRLARRLAWRARRAAWFERRELRGIGPAISCRSRHDAHIAAHPIARRLPTVALINHRTISRSEYLALLLQAGTGCVLAGSASAGCVGDLTHFRLSPTATMTFTGQKTLTADGTELQGVGLAPDLQLATLEDGTPVPRHRWITQVEQLLEKGEIPCAD